MRGFATRQKQSVDVSSRKVTAANRPRHGFLSYNPSSKSDSLQSPWAGASPANFDFARIAIQSPGSNGTASPLQLARESGVALPGSIRQRMEPLFGADLAAVRIHNGAASHHEAARLGARAFTIGQDIHFGPDEYRPGDSGGMRLLAHELAHTLQQGAKPYSSSLAVAEAHSALELEANNAAQAVLAGRAASVRHSVGGSSSIIQRDPKQPAERIDVAVVLTSDSADMDEARTYAPTVLQATSPEDLRDKLKALGKPIGTMFVVTHSTSTGEVRFGSGWVPISTLGPILKQGLPAGTEPKFVDFRGCKVGEAPEELEKFRSAVGAEKARGSTCSLMTTRMTPLTYSGADVTSPKQIPKGMEKQFDQALLDQLAKMKSDDGHQVQDCVAGLAPGEKVSAGNLKKLWDIYWANQGKLIATWASPKMNEWQNGAMCTKDMTESTDPCKWVVKSAPAASKEPEKKTK